jgi:DNA primase small subunit
MVGEQEFLHTQFQNYYKNARIESVPDIHTREFGIGEFGKKIVKRHLSFSNQNEFNAFLETVVPFYISYSTALYQYPGKFPMEAKKYVAADLVYEFDAGDMPRADQLMKFFWKCSECQESGKGMRKACTNCGGKTSVQKWITKEILEETKKETFRLLAVLENELGIREGISINFSGNAGYHVHVRNSTIRELSPEARIEIVDYLSGMNLMPESHGFYAEGKRIHAPDTQTSVGWNKRIVEKLLELLEKENVEELATYGHAPVTKVKNFLKNKDAHITTITEQKMLPPLPGKSSEQFWFSLIERIVEQQAIKLDRQVSTDIKKILRVPDTIHGSTGLPAQTVDRESLKSYNPLTEAVVLPADESVGVFIDSAPQCIVGGQRFGPYDQSHEELPLFAAVYLVARGAAVLDGKT